LTIPICKIKYGGAGADTGFIFPSSAYRRKEADGSAQGGIQTGSIYDIEPDQSSGKSERASLPRRVRFYRSVIEQIFAAGRS